MSSTNNNSPDLIEIPLAVEEKKVKAPTETPANLGKAWNDCVVPDFNDPNRPKTCLEVDFPIAQINALSQLEGNAGKPIYQMSKWWARRRMIHRRLQKSYGITIIATIRKLANFLI